MSIKNQLISGRVPVTPAANVAADRYQYLDLSSAEPNLGTSSNNGDVLIYDSTVTGGRRWIPQSDIVGSVGVFAYAEANTASANTIYLSGVDLTQNNRLNSIETVNIDQNTAISIIQGVDLWQNTQITAVNNFAAGAYNTANGANGLAQGAYNQANTNAIAITVIEGVNLTQNTNITAVNNFAQSAFNTANVANDLAQGAYNTANGANGLAQGAYNEANNKLNLSGGTLTGSLVISANNDLTVTGNLTVLGNTVSVGTQTLEVVDPMIILAIGNYTSDALDIGFAGHYNDGSNAHTGLIRDYANKNWYLFQGYTPELSGNNEIDINHASFDTANLVAKKVTANIVSTTVTIDGRDQASVDATQNNNISIIQGVDLWQNTQITSVNSLAQAAFNRANTGARATASNTAPTGNTVGDLWLSLTDETLYMYSYDGVSNNWIDISGPILISSNILVQYTITANVS